MKILPIALLATLAIPCISAANTPVLDALKQAIEGEPPAPSAYPPQHQPDYFAGSPQQAPGAQYYSATDFGTASRPPPAYMPQGGYGTQEGAPASSGPYYGNQYGGGAPPPSPYNQQRNAQPAFRAAPPPPQPAAPSYYGAAPSSPPSAQDERHHDPYALPPPARAEHGQDYIGV